MLLHQSETRQQIEKQNPIFIEAPVMSGKVLSLVSLVALVLSIQLILADLLAEQVLYLTLRRWPAPQGVDFHYDRDIQAPQYRIGTSSACSTEAKFDT